MSWLLFTSTCVVRRLMLPITFQNSNLLQAALHLVKELDTDSLEVLADAVRNRLEDLC